MTKLNRLTVVCALFALCSWAVIGSQAQTFSTLTSFDGTNGAYSEAALVQGLNGNFYGTTQFGGMDGSCIIGLLACGTVFEIAASGQLITLYNFCSENNCADGDEPAAGLVQGINGEFYGVTGDGGANNEGGTVFQISPAGKLKTLYNFCSQHGCVDGAGPVANMVQAANGDFYGTTYAGGTSSACGNYTGCGTVFKVTPTGELTTLYSFCSQPSCADGGQPYAGLMQATDGNFYGTTTEGGPNSNSSLCLPLGCGTVFKITMAGKLTTLYNFCSQPNCADGAQPFGGLVQASNGDFYGTTAWGDGFGTVFEMAPSGRLVTLYRFCAQPSCADGTRPIAGLVQATNGDLYGSTALGGVENNLCPSGGLGCGTIFEITPTGNLATLYSFCSQTNCIEGDFPDAALMQATNGILYGTTYYGGTSNYGTTFSLDVGIGPFVTFVRAAGKVGQTGPILGQGFTGTTSVMLNGIPANFKVISDTFIKATVPPGATTGYVTVTTPTGILTSNVPFQVIP